MKCLKESRKEFRATSDECWECDKLVDCLMRLYDEPLPTLVLYSADLSEASGRGGGAEEGE